MTAPLTASIDLLTVAVGAKATATVKLDVPGIQDFFDCTDGNWAGCAWTAVNVVSLILPAVKLASAGKAAMLR